MWRVIVVASWRVRGEVPVICCVARIFCPARTHEAMLLCNASVSISGEVHAAPHFRQTVYSISDIVLSILCEVAGVTPSLWDSQDLHLALMGNELD
jgi:hypothetical protein